MFGNSFNLPMYCPVMPPHYNNQRPVHGRPPSPHLIEIAALCPFFKMAYIKDHKGENYPLTPQINTLRMVGYINPILFSA